MQFQKPCLFTHYSLASKQKKEMTDHNKNFQVFKFLEKTINKSSNFKLSVFFEELNILYVGNTPDDAVVVCFQIKYNGSNFTLKVISPSQVIFQVSDHEW